ncbi:MAG: DUF1439 domain-containing protein [Planctomycetota bacterium]
MEGSISIPQHAVQQAINGWLPYTMEEELPNGSNLTLRAVEATVDFPEGQEVIGVDLVVQVDLPSMQFKLPGSEAKVAPKAPSMVPPVRFPPIPGAKSSPSDAQASSDPPSSHVALSGKTVSGRIDVETGIRYEADSGAFFCQNARIRELELDDVPTDAHPVVKRLCEKAIDTFCRETAVYQLNQEDQMQRLAQSHLRQVTIRGGEIIVQFGLGVE